MKRRTVRVMVRFDVDLDADCTIKDLEEHVKEHIEDLEEYSHGLHDLAVILIETERP